MVGLSFPPFPSIWIFFIFFCFLFYRLCPPCGEPSRNCNVSTTPSASHWCWHKIACARWDRDPLGVSKESAYHVRKFAGKMMNLELQEVCNLSAFWNTWQNEIVAKWVSSGLGVGCVRLACPAVRGVLPHCHRQEGKEGRKEENIHTLRLYKPRYVDMIYTYIYNYR